MSYVSLLKNIPEILSQPTGIAALASLGIHGAIAMIVPLMPVDSKPSSQASVSPQTVGILELSQADQNRLPEIATTFPSQLALQPELPQQPTLLPPNLANPTTVLPPLPPPVYRQPVLPPNITSNYRIVPNRNVSLPPGRPIPAPNIVARPVPNIAPPTQVATAPSQEFAFDTSGFNASNQRFTPSGRSFNQSEVRIASQAIPVEGLPRVNSAQLPADLPNTPPRANQTPPPANNTAANNANRELIARLQPTPKAQDNLVLSNQSIPKWQPGTTAKIPELPFEKVNQQTEVTAQLTSYENLRAKIQETYPNSQEKPVIRETILANQPNLQGTVLGFLVVDRDGKVLDIKFQGESVSAELQSKTREYFSGRTLKGNQQISSYPFSLRFQNKDTTVEGNQEQTPAASVKPLPDLQITNEQPGAVVIPQSSNTPKVNNNSLSSTLESGQKLIQQLRQVREKREDSSPE
ncbi:hypothetical protein [Nodularia chucula]|uniref:hypothetical protein n=1 Tax=Nodularia chucula TaxID=3093667 RepID=UPI0039C607F4